MMRTVKNLVRTMRIARLLRNKSPYLAKMDFIEDHLVGVADADESGDEGKNGDDSKDNLVIELVASGLTLGGLCELVELFFDSRLGEVFLARDVSLTQAILGSRA